MQRTLRENDDVECLLISHCKKLERDTFWLHE